MSADAVVRRVETFLQSDLWSELAAARRWFREIDFLLPWPVNSRFGDERAIIRGQIDCLIQTDRGDWKIIDYKTGRVPDDSAAAL